MVRYYITSCTNVLIWNKKNPLIVPDVRRQDKIRKSMRIESTTTSILFSVNASIKPDDRKSFSSTRERLFLYASFKSNNMEPLGNIRKIPIDLHEKKVVYFFVRPQIEASRGFQTTWTISAFYRVRGNGTGEKEYVLLLEQIQLNHKEGSGQDGWE